MKVNSWIKWMILMGRNDLFWVMAQEAKKSGSRGGEVSFTDWCDHLSWHSFIHVFIHSLSLSFFSPMLDFAE